MSFHAKMIKLRKIKGFTQETFATEIGVSRQSVYKWESGQSYPEVEKLLKIARTFGVTVDDMLNDEMEVGRDGTMMTRADYEAMEEKLAREAEEKKARRAAARAKREAKRAEQKEAEEKEAPLSDEASETELDKALSDAAAGLAEEKAEAPAQKAEAPAETPKEAPKEAPKKASPATLPARPAPEKSEKKKGGLFGFLRRKK